VIEALALILVPLAVLTQVLVVCVSPRAGGRAAQWLQTASVAVTIGCLALISFAVRIGEPADCAPLSDGRFSIVVAALVGCLLAAGAASAWITHRAANSEVAVLALVGEVVAMTAAGLLLGVLVGGTTC
jgi:hypothetical protein